ncbi:MAG: hypothetical protein ACK5JT_09750 [Hyphomicrobiaceae bacterium]
MQIRSRWLSGARLYVIALGLVSAGIIHLVVTLVLPHMAKANAFQLLMARIPLNTMEVMPPAGPRSQPIPYIGPDVRLAICHYDVSEHPLALVLTLPDQGWSLGLYTESGDNFYVLPAQPRRLKDIKLTLSPRGERTLSFLSLGRRVTNQSISNIEVPQPRGFAVIRAPLRGRAFAEETDTALRRASCTTTSDQN